jgi:membrane associated rhomboid family serine protease
MLFTYIIVAITFKDERLQSKLLLYPFVMRNPKEAYRLITSGFVHADTAHLAFNMISFYFIGRILEEQVLSTQQFIMLYLSGIVVANLPSYYKHMHNPQYAALGASGGVAAVLFAFIYIAPWERIYLFFALPIPAIVFAIAYLIYSYVMGKKGDTSIGHDAHFFGAVYGLVFMLITDPSHGKYFMQQLLNP